MHQKNKFVSHFVAARRVATPLIAVRTADPAATIEVLSKTPDPTVPRAQAAGTEGKFPLVAWDCSRGFTALNPDIEGQENPGAMALSSLDVDPAILEPDVMMFAARKFPEKTIIFVHNLQRFLNGKDDNTAKTVQALWNLRDEFKGSYRTLVMVGVDVQLPPEVAQDVLMFDEPLPTIEELALIALDLFKAAKFPIPSSKVLEKITDATCGLSAFSAEQVIAMSLDKSLAEKIDIEALWERKRQSIDQTRGLSVWRGGETLDDVVGCENFKDYVKSIIEGPDAPRAIVFMDEGEKMFASASDAGSSVGKEQLQTVLTEMNDKGYVGIVAVGPPGAAKSHCSKAVSGTAKIPCIQLDLGGAKDQYVGNTNVYTRGAFKVIDSVSQTRAMFIMTVNNLSDLPAELLRRFTMGIWFFDLPNAKAVRAAWPIYMKKSGVKDQPLPECKNWTIAEVKNCCNTARATGKSLVDAAKFIVPVYKSDAKRIEFLRNMANGKFIDAEKEGIFEYKPQGQEQRQATSGRVVNV